MVGIVDIEHSKPPKTEEVSRDSTDEIFTMIFRHRASGKSELLRAMLGFHRFDVPDIVAVEQASEDYSDLVAKTVRWISRSAASGGPVEEEFQGLADEWLADTLGESRVQSMILHPSYQRIVGMGERALPLILHRLEREADHWFPALQAIAGENPVPPEDAGNLDAMTRSWLQWGRRRRLLF